MSAAAQTDRYLAFERLSNLDLCFTKLTEACLQSGIDLFACYDAPLVLLCTACLPRRFSQTCQRVWTLEWLADLAAVVCRERWSS